VCLAVPSTCGATTAEIFAICDGNGVFLQAAGGGNEGLNSAIHVVGSGSFKVVSKSFRDLDTGQTGVETSNFPGMPDTTCIYGRGPIVFTLEGIWNGPDV
jgi:hypothetical protein